MSAPLTFLGESLREGGTDGQRAWGLQQEKTAVGHWLFSNLRPRWQMDRLIDEVEKRTYSDESSCRMSYDKP